MQIIEHQTLNYKNLIAYKTRTRISEIPQLLGYIRGNLHNLGLSSAGRTLFTIKEKGGFRDMIDVKVMIPVEGDLESCDEYAHKPIFRLINAVAIRHEGNINDIDDTLNTLRQHISRMAYETITEPYYSVVRADSSGDSIIDIYVGINYNVL
jgi:predicted transcriptional regulator YdeE